MLLVENGNTAFHGFSALSGGFDTKGVVIEPDLYLIMCMLNYKCVIEGVGIHVSVHFSPKRVLD